MGGQVVHHDDVARPQRRHQHLLYIDEEGRPVHRAVEDPGRGHALEPQRPHEGRCLPMPVRHAGPASLPAGARPRNRAILVEAPVSSMKTRCRGSRSGCASNQASRRAATSGRSCSLACAVFFLR